MKPKNNSSQPSLAARLFKLSVFPVVVLLSGCISLGSKEPFQIYAPKTDCVSCKEQDRWGFSKYEIFRHGQSVSFGSYFPKESNIRAEEPGLCLGTALDTLRSGATHFHILEKAKWGNWQYVKTPATATKDIFGTVKIYGEGIERKNLDFSIWFTNHYYQTGSPDCTKSTEVCSNRHKFDVQNCPYEGDELRRQTEEQHGSLDCVMKRNPRLLLEKVYIEGCGYDSDGWISATDVVKKYGPIFNNIDE